jgi:hypothetical protein
VCSSVSLCRVALPTNSRPLVHLVVSIPPVPHQSSLHPTRIFSWLVEYTMDSTKQMRERSDTIQVAKEAKAVPHTPWRRLGGEVYSSYSFSTLDGGEWSALWPQGKDPLYHCIGGWVGPRAGLDTRGLRKNHFASAGDRTSIARSSSLTILSYPAHTIHLAVCLIFIGPLLEIPQTLNYSLRI